MSNDLSNKTQFVNNPAQIQGYIKLHCQSSEIDSFKVIDK